MLDELEELALQVSQLIPLLRLFQEFSSILITSMKTVLKLSLDSSFPDVVCLFSWLIEYKVYIGISGYILQYIIYLKESSDD